MRKTFRLILVLAIIFQTLMIFSVRSSAATSINEIILGIEGNEYISCPFLYTFNGSEFVVENDIISVGRNPGNEYTDHLFLNNPLNPVAGKIHLKIQEIPGESSTLDYLSLLQINHPAGTRAGVDDQGQAHTFVDPAAPIQASKAAQDVLADIATDDRAGVLLYDSQAVELDFPAMDLSAGAKLVIKVHGFQHNESIPDLITPKVPAILIQTEDGSGNWTTRGKFYPKQLAAYGAYDLQQFLDPAQPRVRLVSISCNQRVAHLIDYVGLDPTSDQLTTAIVPVNSVIKNGLEAVSDLTRSPDSQSVQLKGKSGDYLDLEFQAVPTASGVNDFVFTAKGFYEQGENTYYIDTKDNGSNWTNRTSTDSLLYTYAEGMPGSNDKTVEIDLTGYQTSAFPTSNGIYQIKIRNSVTAGSYGDGFANIDRVYLKINGTEVGLTSAMTDAGSPVDVLAQVSDSDNIKVSMTNAAIIVTFSGPVAERKKAVNLRHELVTLLTNPTDGTGVRTMDLNYYLNDPVIWGTDVKNITVWLESEIFDLAKAQQKARLPAGLTLLKDYNIRLMMKIVYKDGTVETREVDNGDIARNIPVLIPIDEFAGVSNLGIIYMDTKGQTAVLPVTTVTIDGYKFLQFENNHFSEYGVVSGIAPTPAPAAPKQQTYTILPGDTLASIAAKFGVTVQSLAAANKISNPDLIFAGKDLIIA